MLASFLVVALFALHRAWLTGGTTLLPSAGVTKTELSPVPRVKLLETGEGAMACRLRTAGDSPPSGKNGGRATV